MAPHPCASVYTVPAPGAASLSATELAAAELQEEHHAHQPLELAGWLQWTDVADAVSGGSLGAKVSA